MGVVKRQGIKQSIVTYVGVLLGIVNVLVLYPYFLQREELGVISFVRETAVMFSLFAFLGSAELIVRYFPRFRDDEGSHHGFLFFLNIILAVGCLVFSGLFYLFQDGILEYYGHKNELYLQLIGYVVPMTVLIAFSNLFWVYASNFQRITVPSLISELIPKTTLPVLAGLYFFGHISFQTVFNALVIMYAVILLAQMGYVRHLGQLRFRRESGFLKKPLLKEMGSYMVFGFFGSLGSRFSSEFISIFMVGTLSTLTETGIYTIALFISNVIDVPRRAISKITSPLLADKWEKQAMGEIKELYQKSSLNQLIVGLWVFLAVWVSVDELFELMPNGELYDSGKYVILILGTARVIDMMTGVNSEMLSYSKHFRYNFFLVLVMAGVNIAANLVLIPKYGLVGAAASTLVSIALFNFLKFWVVRWKMGMQPFTGATVKVLLIAGAAYLAAYFLPETGMALLDLVLRSAVVTGVLSSLVLFFRVSPDLNQLVAKGWEMLERFRKSK